MAKKERETITTARAGKLLGVTLKTINAWCNIGLLEFYPLSPAPNSERRVYVDSVIAYAKRVQRRDITA